MPRASCGRRFADAATLVERLGRPLWIDFVADTGDDRDVSARGRRASCSRSTRRRTAATPRSCRAATSSSSAATPPIPWPRAGRSCVGWSSPGTRCCRRSGTGGRRRVLLGIPGNHDWYDGLDGFARLFRRDALVGMLAHWEADRAHVRARKRPPRGPEPRRPGPAAPPRRAGRVRRTSFDRRTSRSARSSAGERSTAVARLTLRGYTPVQEASHWALPLAPGLDLWGVDRQLRRLDFRQRTFFIERRAEQPGDRLVFLAPDPALSFGEPNPVGHSGCSPPATSPWSRTACSI